MYLLILSKLSKGKTLIEEEEYLGVNSNVLITGIISSRALSNFNSVMTTFFASVKNILGSFYVAYTNFKTLNTHFFHSGDHVDNIYILNNDNLESVGFLSNLIQQHNKIFSNNVVHEDLNDVINYNILGGKIVLRQNPN